MEGALGLMEMVLGIAIVRTSILAYATVNGLHILCLGLLLGAIIPLDLGVLRVRGFTWARQASRQLRRMAITAFIGTCLTGVLLLSVRPGDYLENKAFLVKIAIVLSAGANAVLFACIPKDLARKGFAAVSLCLWCAALFAGRFIGFV
jgi:hypothetical protein